MTLAVLAPLAQLPIADVAVFLVGLRWPASRAMPLSYLSAVFLALLVWKVSLAQVAAASINGLIVALQAIGGAAGAPSRSARLRDRLVAYSRPPQPGDGAAARDRHRCRGRAPAQNPQAVQIMILVVSVAS